MKFKVPKKIINKFGEAIPHLFNKYEMPYTLSFDLANNLVLLVIRDLERDSYKKDWYNFNNALIYSYKGRKFLYLVVEKFYELGICPSEILNKINEHLGFYDEESFYSKNCLASPLSAVKQVGLFLAKHQQYHKKQYDFTHNLMIRKNGDFIFCDPLI